MNNSINITGLLGVAFVILKLTKVINWDWIWVTCPFWAGILIAGFAILITFLVKKRFEKRVMKEFDDRKSKAPKSKFHERLERMQKESTKRKGGTEC